MVKLFLTFAFCLIFFENKAQFVEVQYDYNNVGDCIFGASNNSKTPLYLNLIFTSLENTRFTENLPYVKKLEPGYNGLFTLLRESDTGAPFFIFEIKTFRSNPTPEINLDFPYLIPFAPGTTVNPVNIENIKGFWGDDEPKSWKATGFKANQGQPVYAARQGQVVEITGVIRSGDPKNWYNAWTNVITLLQPDGTLITYKNVIVRDKNLKINQIMQAGEILGEVAPNSSEVILMIYHNLLNSNDLQFIIPVFVTSPGKTEILNPALNINVVHPNEVRGLEMTKKEQKKLLK
ncbi:MAG TPA: peptidoglycan DD-metalloendopeptidase family protein [Draconibacterium sp.]|nr:peptidoglycan DD-metalloendopeptidase family protein [Draconibacterium sp.]